MDVEATIFNGDIALLKAFAPAVRILAGEILLQVVPAAFGQVSIHHNGGATAQFTAVLLDRKADAFHMSGQVGFVLAVEILFQVVALPFDLLGDGCCVGGQFPPAQFHELIFLTELAIDRQKFRRQRRIQFES